MKILFLGDQWLGSNARSLADGFRQAGAEVRVLDTTALSRPSRGGPSWVYKKITGRRNPKTADGILTNAERAAKSWRPDVLFGFKTIHFDQDRLLSIPASRHVHYSADDVSNPYNTTPDYLSQEFRWDLIVTTKSFNAAEISTRSGVRSLYVRSAFDPAWHYPRAIVEGVGAAVGFIGNWRADRAGRLRRLARRYRSGLLLCGPGWQNDREIRRSGAYIVPPAYGSAFSEVVARVQSNLILLNTENRDQHTCRSFEVPAAGGLFVGVRTREHEEILKEDAECFMFASDDEMDEKLAYIRDHPTIAEEVAIRGMRRVVADGNRYSDRAAEIMLAIGATR